MVPFSTHFGGSTLMLLQPKSGHGKLVTQLSQTSNVGHSDQHKPRKTDLPRTEPHHSTHTSYKAHGMETPETTQLRLASSAIPVALSHNGWSNVIDGVLTFNSLAWFMTNNSVE